MSLQCIPFAVVAVSMLLFTGASAQLTDELVGMVKYGHPDCVSSEFNTSFLSVFSVCKDIAPTIISLFDNHTVTTAQIKEIVGQSCTSTCAQEAATFTFHKCVIESVNSFTLAVTVGCEKNPTTDERCLVELMSLSRVPQTCSLNWHNDSTCTAASTYCYWNNRRPESQYDRCRYNPRTYVPGFCTNSCIKKMLDSTIPASGITGMAAQTCLQVDGEYCNVAELRMDMFEGDSTAVLCSSPKLFECAKKAQEMEAKRNLAQAVESVRECVAQKMKYSYSDYDYALSQCTSQIEESVSEVKKNEHLMNHMCARNAEGKWCVDVLKEVNNKYESDGCVTNTSKLMWTNCSDCHTNVSNYMSELGCCAAATAALQNPLHFPKMSTAEIEKVLMDHVSSDPEGQYATTTSPPDSFTLPPGISLGDLSFVLPSGISIGGISLPGMSSADTTPTAPYVYCGYSNKCDMFWTGEHFVHLRNTKWQVYDGCTGVDLEKIFSAPCTVPTISPTSSCFSEDFVSKVEAASLECETLDEPSGDVITKEFLDGACNSKCATAMLDLEKYSYCLPGETTGWVKNIRAICSKDDAEEYCGLHINVMEEADCERYETNETCLAKSLCQWKKEKDNRYNTYRCEFEPTDAYLTRLCKPCLSKMAQIKGDREMMSMSSLMCAKEGVTFCFPSVMNLIGSWKEPQDIGNATTLKALCDSKVDVTCFRKVIGGVAADDLKRANENVKKCFENAKYSSYYSTQEWIHSCVKESGLMDAKTMLAMSRNLCKKNAAGTLCFTFMESQANNTCNNEVAKQGGTCSAECSTELKTLVDTAGCCMGTIQETFNPPIMPEDVASFNSNPGIYQVPVFRNKTAVTVGANQEFVGGVAEGFALGFGKCDSLNATILDTLHISCGIQFSTARMKKQMALPLSYRKIKNNPELAAKLVRSLVSDIAASLGVPESYITDVRLVEDTTRKIRVSGRRMATLAEDYATKLEFELQSESDDDTTTYSEKFDTMVANDEVVLQQTENVVETECTDCKAEGATTLTSDDSTYTVKEAESGASVTTVVLAVIAAVIASVL